MLGMQRLRRDVGARQIANLETVARRFTVDLQNAYLRTIEIDNRFVADHIHISADIFPGRRRNLNEGDPVVLCGVVPQIGLQAA